MAIHWRHWVRFNWPGNWIQDLPHWWRSNGPNVPTPMELKINNLQVFDIVHAAVNDIVSDDVIKFQEAGGAFFSGEATNDFANFPRSLKFPYSNFIANIHAPRGMAENQGRRQLTGLVLPINKHTLLKQAALVFNFKLCPPSDKRLAPLSRLLCRKLNFFERRT